MGDFEVQAAEVETALASFPKGLRLWATAPETYQMHYFNGTYTYTERFLAMKAPKEVIGGWVTGYDAAFHAVALACATIPLVGPALGFLVEAGAAWYKDCNLDADGGITLFAARHYAGTSAMGVDLTAWPIPGMPPEVWNKLVDGAIAMAAKIPQGAGQQTGGGQGQGQNQGTEFRMAMGDHEVVPVRGLVSVLGEPIPLVGRSTDGERVEFPMT